VIEVLFVKTLEGSKNHLLFDCKKSWGKAS